ncbi:MAG: DNA mismatch repair protein MutT, partial [Planctomycetota bacterium]
MTDPKSHEGEADTPMATGRFLSLVSRNGWEFATRVNARGVVAVVATTEANELVLVEQFRPPVGRSVIEIPAGLVGDDPRAGDEG